MDKEEDEMSITEPQDDTTGDENAAVEETDSEAKKLIIKTKQSKHRFLCERCGTHFQGHRKRHIMRVHPGMPFKRKNPEFRPRKENPKARQTRRLIKCPVPGCSDYVQKVKQHLRKTKKHFDLTAQEIEDYCAAPKIHLPAAKLKRKKPSSHSDWQPSAGDSSPEDQGHQKVTEEKLVEDKLPEEKDVFLAFGSFLKVADRVLPQNIQQVRSTMQACQLANPLLLITERDEVRKWYLERKEIWKASTLLSYIASLKLFSRYVQHENLKPMHIATQFDNDLKLYQGGLSKLKSRQKAEREAKEDDQKLEVGDIQEFLQSPPFRYAVKLLGEYSENHDKKLTQRDFLDIQDHLIINLSIDNAQRSGAIRNITVLEFKMAERDVHSDEAGTRQHIIKVSKHKTNPTYGSAMLAVNEQLYRQLETFFEKVRKKLPCYSPALMEHNDSALFISYNGTRYDSSSFSRRFTRAFKGVGENQRQNVKHVTSRKLRQLAVTQVYISVKYFEKVH